MNRLNLLCRSCRHMDAYKLKIVAVVVKVAVVVANLSQKYKI